MTSYQEKKVAEAKKIELRGNQLLKKYNSRFNRVLLPKYKVNKDQIGTLYFSASKHYRQGGDIKSCLIMLNKSIDMFMDTDNAYMVSCCLLDYCGASTKKDFNKVVKLYEKTEFKLIRNPTLHKELLSQTLKICPQNKEKIKKL